MNGFQKCERPEGSRANAEENAENTAIVSQGFKDRKVVETLRARAALAGHEAQLEANVDGRLMLIFRRLGQSWVFTHHHDASAFLVQQGSAR